MVVIDELEVLESRRPDMDQAAGSPTIILLPHGRILVVDATVFARFQSESNGVDLFELGDRMFMHEQSLRTRYYVFILSALILLFLTIGSQTAIYFNNITTNSHIIISHDIINIIKNMTFYISLFICILL